jgi:type IV secretory pathway VirD2 relaxase
MRRRSPARARPSNRGARRISITFRFTAAPEDASQMPDLRAFTRELMTDAESGLGAGLGH